MTNEIQTTDKILELTLTPTLCIETVVELYEQLRPALDLGQTVSLDASTVESVDTTNLQLLAAFVLELGNNGTALQWRHPSEAFLQSATIAGLVDTLRLAEAA